jgi:hypothetical protein
MECKKKFGQEYIYDNDLFNLNQKINCDNDNKNKIKVQCKINFNGDILNYIDNKNIPIEHFSNKIKDIEINYIKIIYLFILLIIILLIIIFNI